MFYISVGYIIIYLENLDYQYLPEYQDHLEWNNKRIKWKYDNYSMYYDNNTVAYLLVLLGQLFQVFLCNPKISQKINAFSIFFDMIIISAKYDIIWLHLLVFILYYLPVLACLEVLAILLWAQTTYLKIQWILFWYLYSSIHIS